MNRGVHHEPLKERIMELHHESTSPPVAQRNKRTVILALLDVEDMHGGNMQHGTTGYLVTGNDATELLVALTGSPESGYFPTTGMRKMTLRWHVHEEVRDVQTTPLSPREKDVLRALVDGSSYKMIASDLGIGFETVRSHIKKLYGKLAVHNNTEAVAKTLQFGLLT